MGAAAHDVLDYRAGADGDGPGLAASFNLDPETSIAHFKAKGLKPTFAWQDMIGAEHDAAFTVAKMADVDLLADVQAAVDDAIATGKPFEQFRDSLAPHLKQKGWWGRKPVTDPMTGATVEAQLGSTRRLQTIFRTNMQSAYSVGAWEKIEAQAEEAPWLRYVAIDDHRLRPEHRELDDTVLRWDSPFWRHYYPPNGWNCRCGAIQHDDGELNAMGVKPSPEPTIKTYPWTNPRTGTVHQVPRGLDPGWDHNPGQARMAALKQQLTEKLQALPAHLQPKDIAALAAAGPKVQREAISAAQRSETAEKLAAAEAQAAQGELAQIAAGEAPDPGKFKATALKQLQKTKRWQGASPQAQLAAVDKRAATLKAKHATQTKLSGYKQAVLAGKQPSPAQQQALESLPQDEREAFLAKIGDAKATAEAKQALDAMHAPNAPIMQKAALKQLQASGEAGGLTPVELLDAVKAKAAALQAQATQAQAANAYKKALIAGKIPNEKQAEAFNALPSAKQLQMLDAVDAAKAEAAAAKQLDAYQAHAAGKPPGHPAAIAWAKVEQSKGSSAQKVNLFEQVEEAEEAAQAAVASKAPTPPAGTAIHMDRLVQTGPQGGTNPGGTYLDQETGIEWYIKTPASRDLAANEVLAGKLYEAAGVEIPEMQLVTMGGQPSVASRIVDGLSRGSPNSLGTAAGARENYVVDAWLANWDVVGLKYDNLMLRGNRAVRVDTGGALRYRALGDQKPDTRWTDDVQEIESLRDAGLNPQAAKVFGGITDDELLAGARRVVAIDDATIRALVRAHGPADDTTAQALVARLIARREDIAQRFPAARTRQAAEPPEGSDARVTPREAESIADARANGYALHTDADMIEDQQVLLSHYTAVDGAATTRAWAKLRGRGTEAIERQIQSAAGKIDLKPAKAAILTAVKGIASRATSGWQGKDVERLAAALRATRQAVEDIDAAVDAKRLSGAQAQPAIATLEGYREHLEALQARVTVGATGPAPPQIDLDALTPRLVLKGDAGEVQWQQVRPEYEAMDLDRGHAHAREERYQLVGVEEVFEHVRDDGTRLRYITQHPDNALSLRGQLIIDTPGGDAAAATRALEALGETGIDTRRASDADARELYLNRQLYVQTTGDPERQRQWQAAAAEPDQATRIERLTTLSSTIAGRDVTRAPEWGQHMRREAFGHGRFRSYRSDIDPEAFREFEKDHVLFHNPTGLDPGGARKSGEVLERLLMITDAGGSFASLADRVRRGVDVRHAESPEADFQRGGANYYFTRIQARLTRGKHAGIVFKTKEIKRTDAVSYAQDAFGDSNPEFIQEKRRTTPQGWAEAARESNNETNFRDTMNLFDATDIVVFYDKKEYQRALVEFRARGYDTWPDGRALGEVFTYRGRDD